MEVNIYIQAEGREKGKQGVSLANMTTQSLKCTHIQIPGTFNFTKLKEKRRASASVIKGIRVINNVKYRRGAMYKGGKRAGFVGEEGRLTAVQAHVHIACKSKCPEWGENYISNG